MSLNVLVTAASRRVALVEGFRRALATLGVRGSIVATDVSAFSPAAHTADRAYRVPLSNDPGYLRVIAQICEDERIGLLVPTIDDELELFGLARHTFLQMGVQVACSPAVTGAICDDKYRTCRHLLAAGVPAAASYLPDGLPNTLALPVFVKPRRGRGSVGAFTARTRRELDFFVNYVEAPVVQEFLAGQEYTIDMLCDFEGGVLSVVPRERAVIRAGVIDRGRTVLDPRLIDLGVACARALRFEGAVNVQCRVSNGVATVFEINPRFSGGIPLTIAAGADFPRMLVLLTLGRAVEPAIGRFTPDLWMTSYESSLFLPAGEMDVLLAPGDAPGLRMGAVA